ncbi:unnamed protein product [Callosobruchus maculatus]|uniref:Uncharacterized protein n=1 Tax=Callosobruchus maculatus TaxID=64391 RepID=A0A653D3K8_CALMS|nr:unnamed protein product [Callosobruchus maculatus]
MSGVLRLLYKEGQYQGLHIIIVVIRSINAVKMKLLIAVAATMAVVSTITDAFALPPPVSDILQKSLTSGISRERREAKPEDIGEALEAAESGYIPYYHYPGYFYPYSHFYHYPVVLVGK